MMRSWRLHAPAYKYTASHGQQAQASCVHWPADGLYVSISWLSLMMSACSSPSSNALASLRPMQLCSLSFLPTLSEEGFIFCEQHCLHYRGV